MGFTALGSAATSAVGLLRIEPGTGPVQALVRGTGYGRLQVDAAAGPRALVFAADAPRQKGARDEREVRVRQVDDRGMGPQLVLRGPDGTAERGGQYGASWTPLTTWLSDVAADDTVRAPSAEELAAYEEDLRAGRVDALVLPEGRPSARSLLESITAAFGTPDRVGGVYVWDVRSVTDGAG